MLKAIFKILPLFLLLTHTSFWYSETKTWEKWYIRTVVDKNKFVELKSTLSYPSGFLDGTIYDNKKL